MTMMMMMVQMMKMMAMQDNLPTVKVQMSACLKVFRLQTQEILRMTLLHVRKISKHEIYLEITRLPCNWCEWPMS